MDFNGASFPTLTPRISELYGASRYAFRVGEASAYAQDLYELEHEEKALENMIQDLVNRQASIPIGVNFHREGTGNVAKLAGTDAQALQGDQAPFDLDQAQSSPSEEEDEGIDEDEDEMMDDEEEEMTTGRDTIVREVVPQRDEDSSGRSIDSQDDSMEMEVEVSFTETT
ncbi:uncharacterized protein PHALS_04529 [Plasmopara halstedii]|uniref:Uncharacterized protein n=1 Tax=Plasmopara halstedii TaxID=4781 RepID=A0A0P1A9Q8_PLAHL|nr:uncharacterized protein PHALS_04529 [Plasmopara halstedii]CEG37068.1 hypothetical protein PHALS_04529 [Plasmopara halstedii]|eukprot:XP_024573437.1 hypothetical protein PHALS_04529 [Plasmopara halstedii]